MGMVIYIHYKWKMEDGKIFIDVQKHRIWEMKTLHVTKYIQWKWNKTKPNYMIHDECILKIHIFLLHSVNTIIMKTG